MRIIPRCRCQGRRVQWRSTKTGALKCRWLCRLRVQWKFYHGFWGTHFETTDARAAFLEQIVRWPCWGAPDATWCDVEREIATRIRAQGLVASYQQAARRERTQQEREMLAHLLEKYGPEVSGPMQSRSPEQMGLL